MRPVRILLVAIALLAVGLTGWAFGTRGGGYSAPEVTAPPPPPPHPRSSPRPPRPRLPLRPRSTTRLSLPRPAAPRMTTAPPAQRPRILGFGSEPVLPTEGAFWQLPSGAGLLTMVLDAPHATRVEFWLTPTGSGVSDLSRKIGQDTNGRDGWLFNWHYPSEPILGHLTVRAIGPGGTAEKTVGLYHPTPGEQP